MLPADKLKGKVDVELSAGRNRIQLAGRSKTGLESLRETVEVFSGKASEPKTHLVAIGASEYQQSARNLNYAVKDVSDLRDTLTDENTVVHMLANEDVTRENVRQIKAALMETGVDDKVILFYAGHGMLTGDLDYFLGTYDVDFSSPEERGLDYRTLEYLFDGIPARNRLMLIDACHSGEADKFAMDAVAQVGTAGSLRANSGLARGLDFGDAENETDGAAQEAIAAPKLGLQNSFNLSKQLFADIRKDTGVTVISASGSTEFAWEDGSLSNGVFTYSLLKGLREGEADQDGDGAVKISELQSYVRAQVVKLTNGLQQPTFRTENIENDWSIYRVSD
ncbi:MAG: caspase domain-containing protein [Pseudomonadales bacterium]